MEKSFQFVDTTKLDNVTRRLMRSHVMRGKNAGKTVNRRSRLQLGRRVPYGYADDPIEEMNTRNAETLGLAARNYGNALRFFKFPMELSELSMKTIDQFFIFITEKMYPSQLGLSSNKYKYEWLQTTFVDEDASNCSLALMVSTNEFFVSGGISSPNALSCLSRTFALVKRRMQSDEALSDSTLCMVMMLILQEQIRHKKESQIHYKGLREMIELRGGLSQLESSPTLLLKMTKMDVLYALQYGMPLVFFRDRMSEVRVTLASKGLDFHPISTSVENQYEGLDPYLQHILLDIMSVTALFNNRPVGQTLDISTFLEIVLSICCRLVQFRSLQSPRPESKREAAYHIGSIVFMTTLFLQWDSRRIQEYDLISRRLREVIEEDFDAHDSDLLLWLLFIANLWFSTTERHWLVLRIRALIMQMDIGNWSMVLDILHRFPWINTLHDQTGCTVWNLVT